MSNISEKTMQYMNLLSKDFDEIDFYNFINDLLNLTGEDILNGVWKEPTSEQYKHYIEKTKLYAKYNTTNRRDVGVILIKIKDNKNPANARTLQRNYIAHLLESYTLDACLAAIYSNREHSWRLSFVKKEISVEVGKLKTKVSPAKRYSYLFGKDELNHTAKVQLLDLLENNEKKYTIEEIEEKFSVEKVTKEFFDNYKENYLKLYENLEKNNEFQEESKMYGFTTEEFAKKLMGQIVFLYFLQKKGWLGVSLVPKEITVEEYNKFYNKEDINGKRILEKYYINYSGGKRLKPALLRAYEENKRDIDKLSDIFVGSEYDGKWGSGEKNFIRKLFDRYKNLTSPDIHNKFFDTYLEPFFYKGLNQKRKNQYFSIFNCKIPFLNGGLFEPIDNYLWEKSEFDIEDDIFSNKDQTGILDFFDRFNFTMNEEEPLEKDVAVDPEMLGKIFENLLEVKDRKSKGAFYTPREIVHYMCQESLANFLVNKVGVDYNEIKEFIQYGEMIRDEDLKDATKEKHSVGDSIFNNIIQIDKALENIKIADPAVGSGAFPLGLLNEIVKIRDTITSYLLIYNRLGLFDKKYDESFIINNKRSIYNIKWNTIKNCIYAVDVENSAVDITKLRLWLSIVVDQVGVPKSGPEPLPNLDCKIMQGNSLIDEFNEIKLIDEKFINEFKENNSISFNDGGTYKSKGKSINIYSDQIAIGDGLKKAQIDRLIDLKKELYGTNDSNRKKELIEKIQYSRKELLRLNFAGTSKEKELFEIDCTHNKPYFSWMLEFIEVFIENGGFDIVIGNPPYVQLQSDNGTLANLLENKGYKTFTRMGDIYCLFYEKSIDLLKEKGVSCLITSNKWMRAGYGEKLREYLSSNTNPLVLIDFGGTKVFDSATVDVNILLTEKYYNNGKTKACNICDDFSTNKLSVYIKHNTIITKFDTKENWIISNPIEQSIREKIEKYGVRLKDWDLSINRGILTGYNDAFIIDGETKEKLISEDPRCADIIRPILRGRDIKRYSYEFADLWLLYIPWHFPLYQDTSIKGASAEAENKFKENYPIIYNYLLKYKDRLSKRNQAETGIRYEWYALQRYGSNYWDDFNKPKIMYGEIVQFPKFYFDESGEFYPEATTFIMSGKDLMYIYCLLNSSVMFYLFSTFYAGGGLGENGIRFKKNFLINLPLPNKYNINYFNQLYNSFITNQISSKELDDTISKWIYDSFMFSDDEQKYIEDNKKSGF